jgi:hypothetical protein
MTVTAGTIFHRTRRPLALGSGPSGT